MLKVLIADDEEKICQLIQKLVDWDSLEMEVIGIAHNGIEALEKIEFLFPDVVITDIRMPGHDGLELVRRSHEMDRTIEFIIISGYRHFEYACTALKYGVSDYLLKPIKKDELVDTLRKIRERYRERTKQLTFEERVRLALKSDVERLRTTCLSTILYREAGSQGELVLEEVNEQYYYHLQPGLFRMICIKFDYISMEEGQNLEFLSEKTAQIVEQALSGCVYDHELYVESSFIYILVNYSEDQRKTVRRQCKVILNELTVLESILAGIQVTIGFGEPVTSLKQIGSSLKNARYLVEQRLVAGTGKLLEGAIRNSSYLADTDWFTEFNQAMNQALESLDRDAVSGVLGGLKAELMNMPEVTGHEILQMCREVCNLYLFFMKNHRILTDHNFLEHFNASVDACASAEQLFDYLMSEILTSYEKAAAEKAQEDNRPIRLAKRYINEHYQQPITLEDVSNAVGFNPTYFSSLFKKETGKTFVEYVSGVRMEQAKTLLKESTLGVAAVCEAVGYSDVKYFTKGFIKYTGLKPNEYRKLYS